MDGGAAVSEELLNVGFQIFTTETQNLFVKIKLLRPSQ
jgi:hypothetical protein